MIAPLHAARLQFVPKLPKILENVDAVTLREGERRAVFDELKNLFERTTGQPIVDFEVAEERKHSPLRVGVVFSGGQAPGGHNVIGGLFDALPKGSQLFGFEGGPSGIVEGKVIELTEKIVNAYRNMGGFDMIGSGRTKIETDEQLSASLATAKKLKLDGIVIIGGDDSNTNAALLAEFFKREGCETAVVGVPKTIDGDLKNEQIEISFGHDTACRVYSEMIGNLMRDAQSAKKYFHFVRLMGRSASHITLECAFQTHPNLALIGEEIAAKGMTLEQVVGQICEVVEQRPGYGVILIPEGIIEFIPEVGKLISELNDLLAAGKKIPGDLSDQSRHCFEGLPERIREQLLLDRDPHGNVQVSRIETERLLLEMVQARVKCSGVHHFFGYEGRSAMPTEFDATYCNALGRTAALLIREGRTGMMASVRGLTRSVSEWSAGGIPIISMMHLEQRHGKPKPVIAKALVDLEGAPFAQFAQQRASWASEDHFAYPGPIQFAGPEELTWQLPQTLVLER